MKALLNKLRQLESAITAEKKPFDLFALFTSEEAKHLWDLVVSGVWIDDDEEEATEYLNQRLQTILTKDELELICKVATLDSYDPRVKDLQKVIKVEHGLSEINDYRFYGLAVDKIYIITCKLQVHEELLRLMWQIVTELWQAGNLAIDSEEILSQLQTQGKSARNYSMDRVLEYLIESKCIRGPRYMNADAVKEHGAMIITKVNLNCQAVKSFENKLEVTMNQELAKSVADVIRDKWDPNTGTLSSEEIYQELIARGVQVPEGDMKEIFDTFIKAGIVGGPRPIDRDAFTQHGSIVITSVNDALLGQLDFD